MIGNILPSNIQQEIEEGSLPPHECPKYANMTNELGASAGYIALAHQHVKLATALLLQQDLLSQVTQLGWSIYHLIARENAIEVLNILDDNRKTDAVSLLQPNASGQDCLTLAAARGSHEVLIAFISLLKKEMLTNSNIATNALIGAAKEDKAECVMTLLNEDVDLATCQDNETKEKLIPLLIRCNSIKTLEALKARIGLNALLDLWSKHLKFSPLQYAMQLNHWKIAKIFLSLQHDGVDTLQWLAYQKIIQNPKSIENASTLQHPAIDQMMPILTQYQQYQNLTQATGIDYEKIPVEYDDVEIITTGFQGMDITRNRIN